MKSSFRGDSQRTLDTTGAEEDEEFDPHNKRPSTKPESKKGVGKKIKGLFHSNKKKKHATLLGDSSGDSESDSEDALCS